MHTSLVVGEMVQSADVRREWNAIRLHENDHSSAVFKRCFLPIERKRLLSCTSTTLLSSPLRYYASLTTTVSLRMNKACCTRSESVEELGRLYRILAPPLLKRYGRAYMVTRRHMHATDACCPCKHPPSSYLLEGACAYHRTPLPSCTVPSSHVRKTDKRLGGERLHPLLSPFNTPFKPLLSPS